MHRPFSTFKGVGTRSPKGGIEMKLIPHLSKKKKMKLIPQHLKRHSETSNLSKDFAYDRTPTRWLSCHIYSWVEPNPFWLN